MRKSRGGVTDVVKSIVLDSVFPVGSIYLSISQTSPASFLGGTWVALAEGYALWTTTTSSTGGGTLSAGLPDIQGDSSMRIATDQGSPTGAFSSNSSGTSMSRPVYKSLTTSTAALEFAASDYNSIYGKSSTVQPPAYRTYAWRRTA